MTGDIFEQTRISKPFVIFALDTCCRLFLKDFHMYRNFLPKRLEKVDTNLERLKKIDTKSHTLEQWFWLGTNFQIWKMPTRNHKLYTAFHGDKFLNDKNIFETMKSK